MSLRYSIKATPDFAMRNPKRTKLANEIVIINFTELLLPSTFSIITTRALMKNVFSGRRGNLFTLDRKKPHKAVLVIGFSTSMLIMRFKRLCMKATSSCHWHTRAFKLENEAHGKRDFCRLRAFSGICEK